MLATVFLAALVGAGGGKDSVDRLRDSGGDEEGLWLTDIDADLLDDWSKRDKTRAKALMKFVSALLETGFGSAVGNQCQQRLLMEVRGVDFNLF